MKKSAFTILEITVICVIIGILAAFGIPYLQNVMERSQAEACSTNLKALQKAMDIYIQENDVVPASLALLPQENIDKAFAELMREKGAWKRRIAFFIQDIREHGLAHAATQYIPKLRCLKDTTPPPDGWSYGINAAVAGKSAQEYSAFSDQEAVILDADVPLLPVGAQGAARHKAWTGLTVSSVVLGVTKTGDVGYSGTGTVGHSEPKDDPHHHTIFWDYNLWGRLKDWRQHYHDDDD